MWTYKGYTPVDEMWLDSVILLGQAKSPQIVTMEGRKIEFIYQPDSQVR